MLSGWEAGSCLQHDWGRIYETGAKMRFVQRNGQIDWQYTFSL